MRLVWITVFVSLLSVPAWCTNLFSNGAIDGTIGGNLINNGDEISNSFTIGSSSTVTGVSNIGFWISGSDTPLTLSWVISTLPDGTGTVEGSGSGVSLSTSVFGTLDPYTVYTAGFSVNNLSLGAGTFYLELFNATATNSANVYWDINDGPSVADQNGTTENGSNSFEIDGSTGIGAVPEPASVLLSGIGLVALAGLARLRRRRFQG